MLRINRFFVYLCFLLLSGYFLTGCSSLNRISIVQIEVLQPARFEIPDSLQNIAIINRLPMLNDSVLNQGVKLRPEINPFTTHQLTKYHSGLYISIVKEILESSGRFQQIVEIDETSVSDSDSLAINLVSTEDIVKVRNSNPDLDYLLFFDILTNDELTTYLPGFGQFRMEVLTTTLWQIAALNSDTITYYYNKTDTLAWEGEAASAKEMKRYLPDKNEAVLYGIEESAIAFAKIFVPHWEEVGRMLYLTGNYEMKMAQKLAMQNNWEAAAEIWTKFVDNKNKKIAGKATYNLALANEINGDIESAFEWILKSYFVFEESNPIHAFNTKEYIRILAKRKNEIRKLDEQLSW
jgi:hypothetical protein